MTKKFFDKTYRTFKALTCLDSDLSAAADKTFNKVLDRSLPPKLKGKIRVVITYEEK